MSSPSIKLYNRTIPSEQPAIATSPSREIDNAVIELVDEIISSLGKPLNCCFTFKTCIAF